MRVPVFCDLKAAVRGQSIVTDPVAQLSRELEQMRLPVVDDDMAGSNLVVRDHGAGELEGEGGAGVGCCLLTSLFAGGW